MKIIKIIMVLLMAVAIFLSIELIVGFSGSKAISFWQILLLCFVSAIPPAMGIWAIFKGKNNTKIPKRNIILALVFFAIGAAWLYSVKQKQKKTEARMMNIERSIYINK